MNKIRSAGLALTAALALTGAAAHAQTNEPVAGPFRLTPARGPIRLVDLTPFKGEVSSEILAGPSNGFESSFLVYTRMAPGARPRGLFTLPVDHTYMVLAGKLNVQLGTDKFVAGPETLVLVPAGVPHQVWNEGTEPEADLQAITPAPSRDLASLFKRAEARKIDNAAQYVRPAPPLPKLTGGTGHDSLNERILASRATGSEHVLERLNDVPPGGGRTELHIHPFDQAYFLRQGTLTLNYGAATYDAKENSLIAIPIGVVHANQNNGTTVQRTVTFLLPEPPQGVSLGGGMVIKRQTAQPAQ
jgi:mannose-6-phosphate isomerase-like protein (cupin superfamily)